MTFIDFLVDFLVVVTSDKVMDYINVLNGF